MRSEVLEVVADVIRPDARVVRSQGSSQKWDPITRGHFARCEGLDGLLVGHGFPILSVASVEESTTKAGELGATVMAEPFDVMDSGRMAVIGDPAGAALCLWEARDHPGAGLVNIPGAMRWNDLVTPDADGAASFYGALFGWTTEEVPEAGGYRTIRNGDRMNGGIMPMPPEQQGQTPPNWMPYFGHDDVVGLTESIGDHGGRLYVGPMHMPQGSIAIFGDPQGAVFAAWTGQYED